MSSVQWEPVKIVEQVPSDREILFVPDQNLGQWVINQTGRKMRLWQGSCYAHVLFTKESIERCRLEYPNAPVVTHGMYSIRKGFVR